MVLIKSIMESIPVYWMDLSWIPKGIPEKSRTIFFSFLWRVKQDKKVMPWVRWDRISLPKALGDWGMKNIFLFSKALVPKVSWRMIATNGL